MSETEPIERDLQGCREKAAGHKAPDRGAGSWLPTQGSLPWVPQSQQSLSKGTVRGTEEGRKPLRCKVRTVAAQAGGTGHMASAEGAEMSFSKIPRVGRKEAGQSRQRLESNPSRQRCRVGVPAQDRRAGGLCGLVLLTAEPSPVLGWRPRPGRSPCRTPGGEDMTTGQATPADRPLSTATLAALGLLSFRPMRWAPSAAQCIC